jgi:hypothetical protein
MGDTPPRTLYRVRRVGPAARASRTAFEERLALQ